MSEVLCQINKTTIISKQQLLMIDRRIFVLQPFPFILFLSHSRAEKLHEVQDIVAVCVELDVINPGPFEEICQLVVFLPGELFISAPYFFVPCINKHLCGFLHPVFPLAQHPAGRIRGDPRQSLL